MKARRFTVLILLGFLCLSLASGGENKNEVVSLPNAIGIKEIVSATAIHSPNGFSSQNGRTTCYVTDREKLASLLRLLSDFPSKGGVFKKWPKNISHWRLYIHGEDNKVIALSIYGYSLQSPLDATFSPSANDPKNTKLMKLLDKMCNQRKRANKTNAPHSSITMPPQADSLIEMKLESLKISASGVEKRCRGSFTIRNVGPGYEESPTKIGPSYGVFIYDATGTMLFRNFGGWSGRNKSGDSITIGWNTNSNHLGETSEPAFLIPKPGTYELVIIVYPSKRDTMLCYATKKFNVGASMDSPAAPPSQISDKSEPLNVQVPEGLVAATKQQTNLVKNLKSLKKGMSMAEVKKVLGNPTKESADNLYYHLSESKIEGGYYVTATLRFEKSGLFEGKVGFGHETRSKRKQ